MNYYVLKKDELHGIIKDEVHANNYGKEIGGKVYFCNSWIKCNQNNLVGDFSFI